MCGRFALISSPKEIKKAFKLHSLPEFSPQYNVAPGKPILCIREKDGHKEAVMLTWGLIPFWTKDKVRALINARAESVAEKPAFRNAFKFHRALVVISGFYEWRRESNTKIPFYFKNPDDKPLAVAAIWDRWINEEGQEAQTCSLITTSPNKLMAPVHDRMPVILTQKEAQDIWLNHSNFQKKDLLKLLVPCPSNELVRYPVTTKMNNAQFEDKEAIQPLE